MLNWLLLGLNFESVFFQAFYNFRASISVLNSPRINFGEECKKSIQILYPSCGYPVFLASFIEELCFPNFVFWEPLPKINWQYLCDLVWLLHFVSQSVCVCCELYCSDYDMFVIQLAIRMCDASSFLSLSPHFFFFWLFGVVCGSKFKDSSCFLFLQKLSL